MIGAISGDVIGSVHEGTPAKAKEFALFVSGSRFTDDMVLTGRLTGGFVVRGSVRYRDHRHAILVGQSKSDLHPGGFWRLFMIAQAKRKRRT